MKKKIMISFVVIMLVIATFVLPVVSGEDQLDQEQTQSNNNFKVYANRWSAQSFKPSYEILSNVEIYMKKIGTPPNNVEVSKKLRDENILLSCRYGGLRISPHFYSTEEDIDNLIDRLKKIL